MKTPSYFLLAVICLFINAYAKSVEIEQRPAFQAVRIERAVELSGKLDDPLWRQAKPVNLSYEFDPGENTPAQQQTLAMALFSNDYLYLGFRCFDSHSNEIMANLSDRDKIFQDDYVIVSIDTYSDFQRAYEFAVNPYGIQADLMATLNGEDDSFDLIWQSAAVKCDSGWTAEMAIPFKSLRFANKKQQTWLVHLVRNIPRSSRVKTSWRPIDRNNPSFLSQGGYLDGLSGIKSNGALEILPYALGQQTGGLPDGGDPHSGFHNDKIKSRIGGGIQYSPGPNFSLDAVINPDFSQIESDAAQISINSTFALDYPEKRPFFLIGQELLQTPMYYSRSINNPLGAARIIGKSGSLSYMYLGAYDRNTSMVIPGEEESDTVPSNIKSFANIGRLRYNFANESYLGIMLLMRNFVDAHNYVAGIDWNYRFWSNWYFSGETFLSHTRELKDSTLFQSSREFGHTGHTAGFDGERYFGSGLHAVLTYSSRSYQFGMVYNDFSPTYQTYNGLFPLTDYRQFYMQHQFIFYPNKSFIDRGIINIVANWQFNHQDIKKEQYIQPGFSLRLKGQTLVNVSYLMVNDERFRGHSFSGIHRTFFSCTAQPHNALTISLDGQIGKFIYRSLSPVMGTGHLLSSNLTLKPTANLNVTFSYTGARLADVKTDELFYEGYILRSVMIYQFTSELFFRTIVQYNRFEKSLNLYPLISYKLNAFTTFYAGMTNNYLDFGEDTGLLTDARQYFVKVQYLLSK